ncbi:hypothetical protein DYB36_006221 [Aphanomyces astaci]|uniref:Uncharacterized protein n=1 Tax=Aphanomyces astaci TaxID=112090 RepID=A0A397BC65_APHAT|nr:hypothetical protein DYB36_006221 [Aphanomyces astaci]
MKPLTTIAVTTDLPIVTKKVEDNVTGTTFEILNGTKAPVTTVGSDDLIDLSPSPSKLNPSNPAPGGGGEAPEAPAPARPISAARTAAPPGGGPAGPSDIVPSEAAVSGADTPGDKTNRYVFNTVAGLTLVFLAFFHYLAIDPSFLAPESVAGALVAPNSWELPSFATFMQMVAVVSCANVDTPHAIFVSFTDSFSWINFIVRGSAYTAKSPVVASSLVLLSTPSHRRALNADVQVSATSYDAFGFFQFALRSNVFEFDLFVRAWTFFFIAVMILLVLVITTAVVSQISGRRTPFTQTDSGSYTSTLKEASRRMQGFTVWFITMAVLPLSTVSTYELMRDITSAAGFGSITGIFALLALVVMGGGIVAAGYVVLRQSEVQLSKYRTKITFGVLYTNLKFEFRSFFAVSLLVQYATGVLLAGVVAPSIQMVLLIALHGVYVALLVLLRPFVTTWQLVFTFVFEAVLVAVFGLVYAMAYTTSTDSKQTYAYVVVVLVCVVIVLMFVRSLVKLWTFVIGARGAHDDVNSTRTQCTIPQLHSAEFNSNRGVDTISLNSGSLPSDHYMTLTTPSRTVKLVNTSAKRF